MYCVALPDGSADAIRATVKCTFTYFGYYKLPVRPCCNSYGGFCV